MEGIIDENAIIVEILMPVRKKNWLIADGYGFCLDHVESVSSKIVEDEEWEIEEEEESQRYEHISLHFRNERTLEVRIGVVDVAANPTNEETPYWFCYDDGEGHTTGFFDLETIEKLKNFIKHF